MQSKINSKKNFSYYGFLKAIDEENLPAFDERQEGLVNYLSNMLPLVRPYEYLIVEKLLDGAGKANGYELSKYLSMNIAGFSTEATKHAITYMIKSGFFKVEDNAMMFSDIRLGVELEEYIRDLIAYGLGSYEIDFGNADPEEPFHLWGQYKKEQVKQILLRNPADIMKGTEIIDNVTFAYVTVIKGKTIKATLNYDDGYIDQNTFQWETVANIGNKELESLKNCNEMQVFVRKVENEDGITLPFTYLGKGKMHYLTGPKDNGAHLFRVEMDHEVPDDVFFDFKLPSIS